MTSESVPDIVVARRIRNRRIEVLEFTRAVEPELGGRRVKPVDILQANISEWGAWTADDIEAFGFDPAVYTPDEVAALRAFHRLREEVVTGTPDDLYAMDEPQQLAAWAKLRDAADSTLAVLMTRGRLPEY